MSAAKPPLAPNPGIPKLIDLLRSEKVSPNKVFVAAWKELADQMETKKVDQKMSMLAGKCIAVYVAAVKAIPEIMHDSVLVPSGAFVTAPNDRPNAAGGVLADKRQSMTQRLPKPGTFAE